MINEASEDLLANLKLGSEHSFEKDIDNREVLKPIVDFDVATQLELNHWLKIGALVWFLLGVGVFILTWFLHNRLSRNEAGLSRRRALLTALSLTLPVSLGIVIAFFPIEIGRSLTSFGVICLFFLVLTIAVVTIVLISERHRVPILSLLIVAAVAFGLLGLNDNHKIRGMTVSSTFSPSPDSVGTAFKQWFDSRKDTDRYTSKPYPVYIFAAEGGGIYAAFRTATFLTNLQGSARVRPVGRAEPSGGAGPRPWACFGPPGRDAASWAGLSI